MRINFKISTEYDIEGLGLLLAYNASDVLKAIKNDPSPLKEILQGVEFHGVSKMKDVYPSVQQAYAEHSLEIKNGVKNTKKMWETIQPRFLNLTESIFLGINSSSLKYTVYPSILPMYIRDFKKKRISFPYNKGVRNSIFVIIHELLHVFFYEYINKYYSADDLIDRDNDLWDLSEVINVFIQNEPEWKQMTGLEAKPYLQHRTLYKRFKPTWDKNKKVDIIIKAALGINVSENYTKQDNG